MISCGGGWGDHRLSCGSASVAPSDGVDDGEGSKLKWCEEDIVQELVCDSPIPSPLLCASNQAGSMPGVI